EMYITFEQKINDLGLFTYNKLQDFELLKFLNQLNRFGNSDEEIHSYLNLSGIYNQKNSLFAVLPTHLTLYWLPFIEIVSLLKITSS
ncbi:hypothetical protein, partial [Mycoplasmopsis bovis]|uniref:hypothetical protein n=1 Tax=Mycoplasmopsis bovis TaxID=28903 RepID=UPI003D295AD7